MTAQAGPESKEHAPGSLIAARGREWVVLPETTRDFIVARPLNGDGEFTVGLFPDEVAPASFPDPTGKPEELGDHESAALLRTALRVGFRGSAGPFRSLAAIAVEPRAYQLVPLLLALRMDPVRLLIADDVGIGKTIESALIAKELLEQGSVSGLTVLCSPALAEQWAAELRDKFALPAVAVLRSTATRLENRRPADRTFFEHYPVTVVSTDFIKSETRRALFLEQAPDLVIVDEAHTCVGAGTRERQLRYELLKRLAARRERHLILVTATPHSGQEEAFRQLIGLLKPSLAAVDFRDVRSRTELARHFVQRRRHDIRRFLDQRTAFPGRREFLDVPYLLQSDYGRLAREVLEYARRSVRTPGGGIASGSRWWAALGLLRAVASSPAAAAAALRPRGGTEVTGGDEAEALNRAAVLDDTENEPAEGTDVAPAADDGALDAVQRTRLTTFADAFESLKGPRKDGKLDTLIKQLRNLYADGYDTIVFCRYIATAEYLREQIAKAFGTKASVDAVTGELPPDERVDRIAKLTAVPGRRILVATDCLSEGVNLQEGFQAVVHYDLAWNPTRHEQREGRVDRFGQTRNIVKAVTLYGTDNGIDPVILRVLLRKSRKIRDTTGVSVPVPERSGEVMDTLFKSLLLHDDSSDQLPLDLDFVDLGGSVDEAESALHAEWDEAAAAELRWRDSAERESRQVTKYAHSGLDVGEIETEVEAVRAALGSGEDIAAFTRAALDHLGATVSAPCDDGGFTVDVTALAAGVRQALGAPATGEVKPLVFRPHPPVGPGERALVRTDPGVAGLARYVLDAALDGELPEKERPARRAGVIATASVPSRTILLLVRYRFHLSLPDSGRPGASTRTIVAEDARVVAYRGGVRLPDAEATALLAAEPDGNVMDHLVEQSMAWAIRTVAAVRPELDKLGVEFAAELEEAHRRVRKLAGAYVRGLDVTFQPEADVLGVYVYLPGGDR